MQATQVMRNTGGRFADVSAVLGPGLEVVEVSRGTAVEIEIRWPNGLIQKLDDVPVDRMLRIEQATTE